MKEKQSEKEKETVTVILRHNLRSKSIEGIIQEYKENELFRLYRRKKAVVLFHDVISFNPAEKDLVTNDLLKSMSKQYIKLRGENNLYLIVAHRDKSHTHLHAVCSGVSLAGRSSRVSKTTFRHIKIELEKFQREKHPELIASRNEHETNKVKSKEAIIQRTKSTRQTQKQALTQYLEKAYRSATSYKDFLKQITTQSYEPYYRNGKLQGVTLEGHKYRLSRLGFNPETLQALDRRTSEAKALSELQSIRQGKKRSIVRDNLSKKSEAHPLQNESNLKVLEELSAIRRCTQEREIEMPGIE